MRSHRHIGRMPCDNRARDWNEAATKQGIIRIDSFFQNLGGSKEGFSPIPSEGPWPYQTP